MSSGQGGEGSAAVTGLGIQQAGRPTAVPISAEDRVSHWLLSDGAEEALLFLIIIRMLLVTAPSPRGARRGARTHIYIVAVTEIISAALDASRTDGLAVGPLFAKVL